MEASLDAVVGTVATIAIALLVVVNGAFAANFFLRRDRRFVDRWTRSLVVTDAVLLLAAVGTPVVAMAIKLGAKGVTLGVAAAAKAIPGK